VQPVAIRDARWKTITQALVKFYGTMPSAYGVSSYYDVSYPLSTYPALTGGATSSWTGVSPATGQAGSGRQAYIGIGGTGTATLKGVDVMLTVGGDA
jgi:hypothetical protein